MNSEPNNKNEVPEVSADRREVLEKFGKFAVYAAPFTVLALAKKADAATAKGPGRHERAGK